MTRLLVWVLMSTVLVLLGLMGIRAMAYRMLIMIIVTNAVSIL